MNFACTRDVLSLLVYFYFFSICTSLPALFKCSYETPKDDDVVGGVVIGSGHRQRHHKRATHQKMRFHITFDKSVDLLDVELRKYVVDELVNESVSFWSSVLSVIPPAGPLLLYRKCVGGNYFRLPVSSTDSTVRHVCTLNGCAKSTTCGEVEVPDAHLNTCYMSDGSTKDAVIGKSAGEGVKADFLLYVAAVNTTKCLSNADTIAYAAHCQLESTLDRPIAGHMNLCPKSLKLDLRHKELLISTIKHEMVHALGFSAGLFGYFRDQNGEPFTPRNEDGKPKKTPNTPYNASDTTVRNVTIQDWWTASGKKSRVNTYLVTPAVTEAARLHFGCDKLPGVELENQGNDGTALTHFEKRLFENEAMTGVHTQSPTYSNLTFALLQDTGWYKVDFKKAEHLHWGYKLGCDFAMKSCGEWIKNRRANNLNVDPYCDEVKTGNGTSTRCTSSRDSVALCNLVKYDKKVPVDFQNFDDIYKVDADNLAYYGGSVELADYCPFPQEFDWKDKSGVATRDSRCEIPSNSPTGLDNAALEQTGSSSACFEHGAKQWELKYCLQRRTYTHYGAGCYPFNCTDGRIYVSLLNGTVNYPCYKKGQRIEVRQVDNRWLHSGSIICPACDELCEECNPEEEPPYRIGDYSVRVPCRATIASTSFTLVAACFSSFFIIF